MGQSATRCWTGTWGLLLPKRAPEWFRKKVLGLLSGDVHLQPAPAGSLLLLGFISLDVPEEEVVRSYYVKGISAGEAVQAPKGELRFNVGPTQIIHRIVSGAPAQGLPGAATIWLEDIRTVTDGFNVLGRELGLDLVTEMNEALTGGEFSLLIKGPFRTNMNIVTEAPGDRTAALRSIPRHASLQEKKDPPSVLNAVALIDISFPVSSRAAMVACMNFYSHYFGVKGISGAGPTQYHCCVHFGPHKSLNQTLTFKQDVNAPSWSNAGSIGIYMQTQQSFMVAYAKCKHGQLLASPQEDIDRVHEVKEFHIIGIKDPNTGELIMPLKHTVRSPEHPECPLKP